MHHGRNASPSLENVMNGTSSKLLFSLAAEKGKAWFLRYTGTRYHFCLVGMKNDFCALHFAAYMGITQLVHVVLDKWGADVDVENSEGATALQYAAVRGREAIVQQLLDYKADVNLQDEKGRTALHYAAI